jgi:hypothetical protein
MAFRAVLYPRSSEARWGSVQQIALKQRRCSANQISNRQAVGADHLKFPLAGFDYDRYTPGKLEAATEPSGRPGSKIGRDG